MAHASKSEGSSARKSTRHDYSYSQDSQNQSFSPSHKSGRSNDGSGYRGSRRRSSPTTGSKSTLRETISSFGDDVIRVKNYPKLHGYDNHGYFQPDDIHFNSANKVREISEEENHHTGERRPAENELANFMSSHDPSFQTMHFEKVNPNEVGVRSSKWQKMFQTSATSNTFQKFKRIKRRGRNDEWPSASSNIEVFLEQFHDGSGHIDFSPPYSGVSKQTRDKISTLSLSLILHELACFTSCVLLGCTLFQAMEAISWFHQKPFTENWIFFRWYSSLQTLLVVITCIGFLNRVDTTKQRSLWLLPLFLIPVLCLSVSDYCNKAWELQRLECSNYRKLNESSVQSYVNYYCPQQDLSGTSSGGIASGPLHNFANPIKEKTPSMVPSSIKPLTELAIRGVSPFIMRIITAVSTLVISAYLFCCRNYFLIDIFGPPEELQGSIDVMLNRYRTEDSRIEEKGNMGLETGNSILSSFDHNDGMEVIFQRGRQSQK